MQRTLHAFNNEVKAERMELQEKADPATPEGYRRHEGKREKEKAR